MAEALKARHPAGVVTFGSGYCHDDFHWIFGIVGRFKKVALPDMPARAADVRSTDKTLHAPAQPSQEPTSAPSQVLAASEHLTPTAEPSSPSDRGMKLPFAASTSGLTSQPLVDPVAEERRQKLIASKPRRDGFDTDQDFEEALGFWMGRQGRALAQMETSRRRAFQAQLYEGDIGSRTGSILASWFLANPNGPSLSAIGLLEEPDGAVLFYREMHFTGEKTWLLADANQVLSDAGGDFGKVLLDALERADAVLSHPREGRRALSFIPSFVATNGNPSVDGAFQVAIWRNLGRQDWGKELDLIRRHRGDFFARAGEELRETYESLKDNPETDPGFLKFLWSRFGHVPTFAEWEPAEYEACEGSLEVIAAWWTYAANPTTIRVGADQFAHMWHGASEHVSATFTEQLQNTGSQISLERVRDFFGNFGLPIFGAHR
jgi:hypothetical protein